MSQEGFPWFPFWVRDFLTSRTVAFLNMEEVGVYIMLLCHEWEDGPLPDNAEFLARLIRADLNTVQAVLEQCFTRVESEWVNERLEGVRAEQEDRREKAVKAGKASARARRKSKKDNNQEHRSSDVPKPLELKANYTEADTEEKKEKRKRTAVEHRSPTAAAVGVFLERVGVGWDLKRPIDEWCAEIQTTDKYAGADFPYEIQKAADWHAGKGKRPKPSMAIRNWLERAAKDARRELAKKRPTGQRYERLRAS